MLTLIKADFGIVVYFPPFGRRLLVVLSCPGLPTIVLASGGTHVQRGAVSGEGVILCCFFKDLVICSYFRMV